MAVTQSEYVQRQEGYYVLVSICLAYTVLMLGMRAWTRRKNYSWDDLAALIATVCNTCDSSLDIHIPAPLICFVGCSRLMQLLIDTSCRPIRCRVYSSSEWAGSICEGP